MKCTNGGVYRKLVDKYNELYDEISGEQMEEQKIYKDELPNIIDTFPYLNTPKSNKLRKILLFLIQSCRTKLIHKILDFRFSENKYLLREIYSIVGDYYEEKNKDKYDRKYDFDKPIKMGFFERFKLIETDDDLNGHPDIVSMLE